MKKKVDPRHQARRIAVQTLFEWSFLSRNPNEILQEDLTRLAEEPEMGILEEQALDRGLARTLVQGVVDNHPEIDKIISERAPEWPIKQIGKIDLTILRLSIFEIIFGKTAPMKVAIDEAVELSKEFGGERSGGFVNGVLGTVVEKLETK